jgi:hypothetical protein
VIAYIHAIRVHSITGAFDEVAWIRYTRHGIQAETTTMNQEYVNALGQVRIVLEKFGEAVSGLAPRFTVVCVSSRLCEKSMLLTPATSMKPQFQEIQGIYLAE